MTNLCLTALLLSVALRVGAQTQPDPAAVQRLERELLERSRQEEQLQKATPIIPEIVLPERGEDPAGLSEIRNIPVRQFAVDHSEILSAEEINSTLAPYQGQTLSLKELFAAVDRLNKLYDAKNAKTARAMLLAQEVKDGVVRIRLIEARLGEMRFLRLEHLRPDFIRDRIHLRPGELMSVARLEKDLIRFNKLYESQLRADITSGAAVGTTDINIEVTEPQRLQLTTFADNAGRDTLGENRVGVIFKAVNLLGVSDNLQFVTTKSEGARSYAGSYALPISTSDTRLDIAYNSGSIVVIDGPFVPLDISGRSRDASVGLTQPFAVSLDRQWAAYGRLSARNSISQFSGLTQQDVDLSVLGLGVSGEAHHSDSSWFADHSLNFGMKKFGGEAQFSYYRMNVTRTDRLSGGVQLLSRAGMQYSHTQVLPSGEQFQVGGLYTVRGFSEGLLSGRNGYFGNLELRIALNTAASSNTGSSPLAQALVFIDHGAVMPYRPGTDTNKNDDLTSAGAGLMISFGSRVSGRIAIAYPLDHNPAERKQRTPRIHAGITISWL